MPKCWSFHPSVQQPKVGTEPPGRKDYAVCKVHKPYGQTTRAITTLPKGTAGTADGKSTHGTRVTIRKVVNYMLRIDRQARALTPIDNRRLPDAGLMERYDLQQMIRNSPEAFFAEIGETLLLVAEEARPAEFVDDRIDLLGVDPQGNTVIIELKRGADKLQLLQALSYAAMVSHWDLDRLLNERASLAHKTVEEAKQDLQELLGIGAGDLNQAQRIMLLAEDFDYEVLVTAEWLTEQYEVDIRCYRLTLSVDGEAEYLSCIGIYPPREITEHAGRRGRGHGTARQAQFADWDAALRDVDQPVAEFFRSALAAGQQPNLTRRDLRYRFRDRQRFTVTARRHNAYVWQEGRFTDDVQFWSSRLSQPETVVPVASDTCLRFVLHTPEDFVRFNQAVQQALGGVEFIDSGDTDAEIAEG